MPTEAQAYIEGWNARFRGEDTRYTSPFNGAWKTRDDPSGKLQYAWTHGALDAMEAEDGEEPEPGTAGYHNEET